MSIYKMSVEELKTLQGQGKQFTLVDCREPDEYLQGHIPNSFLMPLSQMLSGTFPLKDLLPGTQKLIVLQCRSGKRSLQAAHCLSQQGYQSLYNLEGGILAWQNAGHPVIIPKEQSLYGDCSGSLPLLPEIKEYLHQRLESKFFANPKANHLMAHQIRTHLEISRKNCAHLLGAHPNQTIFNSGASEGIAHAFHSVISSRPKAKDLILLSDIEHPAVAQCAAFYQEHRHFSLHIVPALPSGLIDLENLYQHALEFKDRIALISVMAANNETGVLLPYKEIARFCTQHTIPYICDTTALIGKSDFNFEESNLDYAVFSGHKLGALPGGGILLAKDPQQLTPLVMGNGYQRGGTQNYLAHETMSMALKIFEEQKDRLTDLQKQTQIFESNLKKRWPQMVIFGEELPRLPGHTLLSLPPFKATALQQELECLGVDIVALCNAQGEPTSRVLKSMGISPEIASGAIRLSLSLFSPPHQKFESAFRQAFEQLS